MECNRYYQTALLNLAIALSLNVMLKQDYELSKDLRQRMRRLLELNLQLKPQLEGDDFRAAINALDSDHYELVYEKLSAIKRDLDTIASNDLSLELYLILKFRAEELGEEDIDALLERLKMALSNRTPDMLIYKTTWACYTLQNARFSSTRRTSRSGRPCK